MNFELSYTEAMVIQRAQMVYYRQLIGRSGCKTIRANTSPCPADTHPDKPISVIEINELVPRGCNFEYLIRSYPKDRDQTTSAWHSAIRRGLQ